jgi:hypothetical protein
MNTHNIASASWGDHLTFGEGDGLLDNPDRLYKRMKIWKDELGITSIHWRQQKTSKFGSYRAAKNYRKAVKSINSSNNTSSWDDFKILPEMAHSLGLKAHAYVSIFGEGWPLSPAKVREKSHHNAMHGQHYAWQSDFTRKNPDLILSDRSGEIKQWGVLCLAYPEARKYLIDKFMSILEGYDFDGVFLCFRTEAKPPEHADIFGFNEPVRKEYLNRYGRDIKTENFDLNLWHDLLGEYITTFLREIREATKSRGLELSLGCARGNILGPPLGNATIDYPTWIKEKLIDELIINQNSSQCPSIWHQLWPMHRGYGYKENYLDGYNMPPLIDHLNDYAKHLTNSKTKLFIARQWDPMSPVEESDLLNHPIVSGLVYSTFRYDNPGPIANSDWVIHSDYKTA